MIGQEGNCFALSLFVFKQLRIKRLFLFDLIARNIKWYEAIKSEIEFTALEELKQIYIV